MYYISGVTLWIMVGALVTAAFTLALAFAFLLRCRYIIRLMDREIDAQARTILELRMKGKMPAPKYPW